MPELLLERPLLEEQTGAPLAGADYTLPAHTAVSEATNRHRHEVMSEMLASEHLGLRDRLFSSRLGRLALVGLTSLGFAGGLAAC